MIQGTRCKGSILTHLRAYVESSYGSRVWQEMLEASSPDDRGVHEGIVLAGGWYPVGVWNRALAWLLPRYHGKSPDEEMRRVAAFIADRDLNSVYKMVLRLGSPEFLLRRTDALWSRYFDGGKFGSAEDGPKRFKLWLDAPGGLDVPDRFTCDPGVCAWIEMGLRNTRVTTGSVRHVDCRFNNGQRCEYVATW